MKKITAITFLLLTAAFFSNAQINNGQFENWTDSTIGAYTYDSLINWMTTDLLSLQNSSPNVHSAQPETIDVYEGSSSIILTSWSGFGGAVQGIPGAASNGNVLIAGLTPSPIGGVPDVVRHAALMGYYKYIPAGAGDHGSIETCLFKRNGANRDTIAYALFDAALNIGTYTQFSVNLIEVNTGTPDSSLIWMQSSPRVLFTTGKTGTVLKVDSLHYSGIIGVDEISPPCKINAYLPRSCSK